MFTPRVTSSEASWQMASRRSFMPSGPSPEGQVASIDRASNTSWSTCRSFSVSELRRIGWGMTS